MNHIFQVDVWHSVYRMNRFFVKMQILSRSGAIRGEANGQLPISFGGLPIEVFIRKFLPIEILLF
jgi:hypothetical protein